MKLLKFLMFLGLAAIALVLFCLWIGNLAANIFFGSIPGGRG